jgi:aspartate/methionine/tyrosine aminotransferase
LQNNKRTMSSAYMEWVKTQTGVRFNLANSGVKNFPFSGLQVDVNALTLSGPGAYGYAPLKKAIAAKCEVPEECVVTAQGTSMANYLAMAAILESGDNVLMEYPSYPLLWEAAQQLGANVIFFERRAEDNFALDSARIEKLLTPKTRMIVITNLHNPGCALTPTQTLREIGRLAREAKARVLVDEVYLDVLFEDAPPSSFQLGPEFVVTNSLTKVYGLSGLRCGWILAGPELARRMYRLNDLFGVNNPYLTDQISCLAFEHLDRIAQWSRELLDRNRALANQFLGSAPGLSCDPLKAGTVLFPRIEFPVDEFCNLLRERYETAITPGKFFGAPEHIRIGIGGEPGILAEGLNRIRRALNEFRTGDR